MPMGSPLSPIMADITLQDLEIEALKSLPFESPFYYRYVDDIVLAAPILMFDRLLEIFNSFHPRLQFTLEEGVDDKLNFLDVTIIIENNFIKFDWYHKHTFSGRFLNFESHHPLCHKRGTAIGLFDRAILLSHPDFHKKNLSLVINWLLDNGYPLSFIFDTLRKRLPLLVNKSNERKTVKEDKIVADIEIRPYFCIPSIKFRH